MKTRRVGLIVPQGTEFDFIREVLAISGGEKIDGEQYHHFQLPRAGVTGFVRVLSDMGQAPAGLAADRLISRLKVSLVVLIGTAAGIESGVQLGDVVVADQIQEYLRKAKAVPGPGEGEVGFERAAESWRTGAQLIDHVNNLGWLADGEPALAAWRQTAAGRRPAKGRSPSQRGGTRHEPAVHVGPVATGDLVIAARSFADWIRAANRKTVALDMEAGGAAMAAHLNDTADLLVVRGVSDYADELKSDLDAGQGAGRVLDAWRRYAVRNAIEYLTLLLSSSGFPWREGPGAGGPGTGGRGSVLSLAPLAAAAPLLVSDHHQDGPQQQPQPGGDHHQQDGHDQHQADHDQGQSHDQHAPGHDPAGQAAATPASALEVALLADALLDLEMEQRYAHEHPLTGDQPHGIDGGHPAHDSHDSHDGQHGPGEHGGIAGHF